MTMHTETEWDEIMRAYQTAEGGPYGSLKAAIAEHERLKEARNKPPKGCERFAKIAAAQNTREYWLGIYPDGNFPLGV